MVLYPVVHDLPTKLWCGPAAISSLTGCTTAAANLLLSEYRRKSGRAARITSTNIDDLRFALSLLGLAVGEEDWPETTLWEWMKDRTGCHLVMLQLERENHWVVTLDRRVCDNSTGKPIALRRAPYRHANVICASAVRRVAAM